MSLRQGRYPVIRAGSQPLIVSFTTILTILSLGGNSQANAQSAGLTARAATLPIGDSSVKAMVYDNQSKTRDVTFVLLHGNEQILSPVVVSNLVSRKGRFVSIVPSLDDKGNLCRFVKFRLGGNTLFFDPNRIWDDSKIKIAKSADCIGNSLGSQLEASQDRERALQAVISFRSKLSTLLGIGQSPDSSLVVAIHNNRNLDYQSERLIPSECASRAGRGGAKAGGSSYNNGDFFLVTTEGGFRFFADNGFNVVRQMPNTPTTPQCQDGSLSVYSQSRGIPFVTVEVDYTGDSASRSALQAQNIASKMINAVFVYNDSRGGR